MATAATAEPDPAVAISRGLAVFALPPGGRTPSHGWQTRCISDIADLAQQWRPGDNVGVGCRASNVVGIDLDRKDGVDGIASFRRLCDAAGGTWPDTLSIATPNAGLHLYFRTPEGIEVPSSTGKIAPGIDVRAPGRRSGGYLIGPDSSVGGRRYLVERDVGLAILPTWLADLTQVGWPREVVR
jgi:hypothetical protein